MRSVLHIIARFPDGTVESLMVGGGASDDAMRVIQDVLDRKAVSVAVTRETLS